MGMLLFLRKKGKAAVSRCLGLGYAGGHHVHLPHLVCALLVFGLVVLWTKTIRELVLPYIISSMPCLSF